MVKFILKNIREKLTGTAQSDTKDPVAETSKPADPPTQGKTKSDTDPAEKVQDGSKRNRSRRNTENAGESESTDNRSRSRSKKPASSPNPQGEEKQAAPGGDGDSNPSPAPGSGRSRSRRRRGPKKSGTDSKSAEVEPSSISAHADWDPASFKVPVEEGKTAFQELDIPSEILHAIADLGFVHCMPIQARILPSTLKGLDAMGRAQTGTGKTAAFLIGIFTHILRNPPSEKRRNGTPRALILAPTRELALQIEKDARGLSKYFDAEVLTVFGGMDYEKQRRKIRERKLDVVVATPGRLLDFRRKQDIHLNHVEILVVDEADRMLDMGFIPDVRQIIHSTPPKSKRQTLFFSATLTPDVIRLANQWTRDAVSIEIEPEQVAVDSVDQRLYVVTTEEKFPLLLNIIDQDKAERVMVFANRRDQTRKLYELLQRYQISCELLSGDVPQSKRIRTLDRFRSGEFRVLVATDVAGRGLHVDSVSHVVNFTLPQDPEDYVHRIGRTGRAGASGISISFACEQDAFQIPAIEAYIKNDLPCTHPEPELLEMPEPPSLTPEQKEKLAKTRAENARNRPNRSSGGRGRSGGGQRSGGNSRRGSGSRRGR